MKNRIGYLFLVAGTFYLLVMYAAKVFLLLLLLELIFPLFQLFFCCCRRPAFGFDGTETGKSFPSAWKIGGCFRF